MTSVTSKRKIKIGVHKGNVLWQIIHTHRRTSEVVVELAQNALDEECQHLHVIIDAKRKILLAYDDGNGTTINEMEELWQNVGTSSKRGKAGKTGEKGIAKLSGLSIAQQYEFTTRPLKIKGSGYFQLLLNRADIKENEDPELDCVDLESGFGLRSPHINFKPTTLIKLTGLSAGALRDLAQVEQVADDVGKHFATKIKKLNANIQIIYFPNGLKHDCLRATARPREYDGTRQKPRAIKTRFGDVCFEMYTSLLPVRKPELLIDHQNGRWSFELKEIPGVLDHPRIKEVLGSGHFQGTISLNFGNLLPDRRGFENDQYFDAFVQAIHAYNEDVARPYLRFIIDEQRAEKEEAILRSVEERLDKFFSDNPHLLLGGQLRNEITPADDAGKKTEKPKKKSRKKAPSIEEVEEEQRKRTQRKREDGKQKPEDKKPSGGNKPQSDPTASTRKALNRFGIRLERKLANQEPRFEEQSLFFKGVIWFNVEHVDWIRHRSRGDAKLQEYVAMHVSKELAAMRVEHPRASETFREIFNDHYTEFIEAFK